MINTPLGSQNSIAKCCHLRLSGFYVRAGFELRSKRTTDSFINSCGYMESPPPLFLAITLSVSSRLAGRLVERFTSEESILEQIGILAGTICPTVS